MTVDTKLIRSILNGKSCPSDMNEVLFNLLDEFDNVVKERDQLRAENARLRGVISRIDKIILGWIYENRICWSPPWEKLREITCDALNEVTNSETGHSKQGISLTPIGSQGTDPFATQDTPNSDYKEHLRNIPESEYRRLHENEWTDDENEC